MKISLKRRGYIHAGKYSSPVTRHTMAHHLGQWVLAGDPGRLANAPDIPWIVHISKAYLYRSLLYLEINGVEAIRRAFKETRILVKLKA